jgi:hypothetical protein
MNTKKVNAQGPGFFDDLHAALDRIEAEFSECAVALTVAASDANHHRITARTSRPRSVCVSCMSSDFRAASSSNLRVARALVAWTEAQAELIT